MDFEAIKAAAQNYQADMTRFLREMISHPSESCEEREVVHCIKAEMEHLGYDKVEIDGLGNVIGWMGDGEKIIAIDSHIDTVGIGNLSNWEADPYEGYETEDVIYGRGGSDQEGGMASAVYGTKIMKDLGLIPEGYKIMVVGSVQEEDCDGMCWQYIVNKVFNGPEDARSKIGAGRQRHLQNGRYSPEHPRSQRKRRRPLQRDQGARENAESGIQPGARRGRSVSGPWHLHRIPDLLYLSLPLRCGCKGQYVHV